jgi:hypothetical protein
VFEAVTMTVRSSRSAPISVTVAISSTAAAAVPPTTFFTMFVSAPFQPLSRGDFCTWQFRGAGLRRSNLYSGSP